MAPPNWLLEETACEGVFTPERLSAEHRLIARTAREFLEQEVLPATDALEQKDWNRARDLLARCGTLGLLGADVPEAFGGADLDKAAAVVICDALGAAASFCVTFGAQTGLSIVPILWFGTADQKQKYLPSLVAGSLVGAYALSESGSGSDALGAHARATRAADGSWRLTGEKMWITNAGFADLFVVFAKVDGEKFTAFLVERGWPGVSTGREEHKMGLHGSSTAPLILQDAVVPAGALLGEIGSGHRIAFNVLNLGRFKLAATCLGTAKAALDEAAAYALHRRQFGQPIASFGAIQQKLADMTARTYAVESMIYRTTGLIDAALPAGALPAQAIATFSDLAVEASLLKVAGSEMLDFVLDENVQIHGGNGFVRDYPAERRYRDARVNRIFEGTNEINRLLVPGLLIKRDGSAGSPLMAAARAPRAASMDASVAAGGDLVRATRHNVSAVKTAAIQTIGLALERHGEALRHEQEIVMLASDAVRDAFAAESAWLRAQQQRDGGTASLHLDLAAVLAHDAGLRAEARLRIAAPALVPEETLPGILDVLTRLVRAAPIDTIAARRRIAAAVLHRHGYPLGRA